MKPAKSPIKILYNLIDGRIYPNANSQYKNVPREKYKYYGVKVRNTVHKGFFKKVGQISKRR